MNAVTVAKVHFSYRREEVLTNITFNIKKGDFLGIIGPNGAGKSTILRIICNILKPSNGKIIIFDQDINCIPRKIIARKIAFVPQETYFALDFTVEEIVMMGRYPYLSAFQKERSEDLNACEHALNHADLMDFKDRLINSLSSGERQRVVLARALAQEPDILLLDEPTSHLDLHHQYAIMELLKKLNNQGISIVIVNHDLNLASLYCQRLVLMHQGEIIDQGRPKDIITKKTLRHVYRTEVDIMEHPYQDVPYILLRPKGD
jgi:iron complex transport system ATP-binding protein